MFHWRFLGYGRCSLRIKKGRLRKSKAPELLGTEEANDSATPSVPVDVGWGRMRELFDEVAIIASSIPLRPRRSGGFPPKQRSASLLCCGGDMMSVPSAQCDASHSCATFVASFNRNPLLDSGVTGRVSEFRFSGRPYEMVPYCRPSATIHPKKNASICIEAFFVAIRGRSIES
jgi:hypothetical protein